MSNPKDQSKHPKKALCLTYEIPCGTFILPRGLFQAIFIRRNRDLRESISRSTYEFNSQASINTTMPQPSVIGTTPISNKLTMRVDWLIVAALCAYNQSRGHVNPTVAQCLSHLVTCARGMTFACTSTLCCSSVKFESGLEETCDCERLPAVSGSQECAAVTLQIS